MAIENDVIKDLLALMEQELQRMESKKSITLEDYLQNWEFQHIVERGLQELAQASIDIGARVIAQENLPKPKDSHAIFDVLSQEKIISPELSTKMKEMVGLRNALVHEYRWIKNEEVYRHLQGSLERFREFSVIIVKFFK